MIPGGSSIAPAQRHDPTVHARGRVVPADLPEPAPADAAAVRSVATSAATSEQAADPAVHLEGGRPGTGAPVGPSQPQNPGRYREMLGA